MSGNHAPQMKNSRTIMPNSLRRCEWFMDGQELAIGLRGRNKKLTKFFLRKIRNWSDIGVVRKRIDL